jgi:AcrR family transcriptional regulator
VNRAAGARGRLVEVQRRRLLVAAIEVVYERGARGLTVGLVSERAGVSRKAFYEVFEDGEGCLLGAFEESVRWIERSVEQAVLDGQCAAGWQSGAGGLDVGGGRGGCGLRWAERVRVGLIALLALLEREPAVARLVIVESLGGGPRTLAARQRALSRAIAAIERGRDAAKADRGRARASIPPLTGELVAGAVFSVIHDRVLAGRPACDRAAGVGEHRRIGEGEPRSLLELVSPLTAAIVGPYLGPVAAHRELGRPAPVVQSVGSSLPFDPFRDLPIRFTRRTALVLGAIALRPGASNREVAECAGIGDEGQMSRLLGRLEKHGLIENCGLGHARGEANAWMLSERGEAVHESIGPQAGSEFHPTANESHTPPAK